MPDPDRGPLQGIVKYNPHLWGDDELRSIFVARNRELAALLDRLRQTPAGTTVPQHVLVVGQRGMGKTTLLRRLALGVRDDPELSRQWIALTFPEEQFTVSTLAELWSNVLDALTDMLENEGAPQAELDRLDGEIHRIEALPPLEREEAAIGLLSDWIDQQQRRILLLIDSTDLLFDSLGGPEEGKRGQKAGAASLWRLRKTLTHHSGFFWLGASYQALESGHLYSDAFHDFFELVELRPLSVDDMRQAMLALARTFGAGQEKPGEAAVQAMARILDAKPERLKALRNLTGGNPRITVMLYELFAADRQDNLHADLKLLLDLMTPLYKARMENLADQPRKLLAHVMERWAPVAAAELAEASGIPVTTVSGQLARLEAEGLIEKAKLPGRRRAGYQVAERFFNVWYLMRYTPRRIRQGLTWLVEFMRLWYSADDLRTLAVERARAHIEGQLCHADHLEYSRALATALGDEQLESYRLKLRIFLDARDEARRLGRPIPEIFPALFDLEGADKALITKPGLWNDLGISLQDHFNCPDEAESAFRHAMEIDPKAARPWYNLGLLLQERLGRPEDAEAAFRQAIVLDPKAALPWTALGDLLQERLGRPEDAEAAYRRAIEFDPKDAGLWNNLGILLAKHLGRPEEAEAAFRRAIELNPEGARPWNNLGSLLEDRLGCPEEAEAAFRRAIELDPEDARPWINLGSLLEERLGCPEEAEAAYRRAIELDPKAARPWNNLGSLLENRLGRPEEAEAVYQHARQLDPDDPYPLANYARLLIRMDMCAEASAAYRRAADLAARSAEERNPTYWEIVLQAHLWLGNRDSARQALGQLANLASGGDRWALNKLREQARECHGIGLGSALAELMAQSAHASFLKPLALALRAAAGQAEALDGIPPELRTMAEEAMRDILAQDRKVVGN
ncbi:MAG: tetratricopeptide repeat protein [Candidatus Competibacter sp.]|nr:tetratricopeptide repeat protein [Candidatus Competibacter sp.]